MEENQFGSGAITRNVRRESRTEKQEGRKDVRNYMYVKNIDTNNRKVTCKEARIFNENTQEARAQAQ